MLFANRPLRAYDAEFLSIVFNSIFLNFHTKPSVLWITLYNVNSILLTLVFVGHYKKMPIKFLYCHKLSRKLSEMIFSCRHLDSETFIDHHNSCALCVWPSLVSTWDNHKKMNKYHWSQSIYAQDVKTTYEWWFNDTRFN